ncbi:YhzD family protein [Alkalihalophilus pseudofirmus]|uniref:YhzD family protein n=1 Tax=Alkalihalophilus pseudofirmus TaxID=79885 RepID=A0AAJ2U469_ALKPS|nr:YhzD family protein [Alkalihalophilus pseudofirmus]MDV2886876.1 YhzD family protein [Alkalihalophilus pseudofirmus]
MNEYFLTVYEPNGEMVFEERIEAADDDAAQEIGKKKLEENKYINHTHRLTRAGKLLLFHV